MFLLMGNVVCDLLAFFVSVDVGVVALDVFGPSSPDPSNCAATKAGGGQTVTLCEDRGFGCGLVLFLAVLRTLNGLPRSLLPFYPIREWVAVGLTKVTDQAADPEAPSI